MARRKATRAKKKAVKRTRKPVRRRRTVARSARVKAKPKRIPARKRTAKPKKPTVRTPPSSLNMNRRGSAVRTGRAEIAQHRKEHATMTPAITGGDVDVDVEGAYFSGDEAPGGDNPTPDQDIVDDIGKALGVQYQDDEELGAEKITGRDKHRWELDPASSDDFKDRK